MRGPPFFPARNNSTPAALRDQVERVFAQIVSEAFYALVRGLETDLNKIQPGMAEKWDISKDGLAYTFTIRKSIPWVKWDAASKHTEDLFVDSIPYNETRRYVREVLANYASYRRLYR